jgi:hypothetical protein
VPQLLERADQALKSGKATWEQYEAWTAALKRWVDSVEIAR